MATVVALALNGLTYVGAQNSLATKGHSHLPIGLLVVDFLALCGAVWMGYDWWRTPDR